MRAIVVSQFGPPAVLVPTDVVAPVPQAGQVLIEVTGAGVGPWDTKRRRGDFGPQDFPFIPGGEISGIVTASRGDTGGLAIGDTVFGGTGALADGYAEYVAVDAQQVAPAPRRIDLEAAGAAPIAAVTALEGLDDRLAVQPGESVLVAGAAGGVGSFVVQIARARGARVIATASPMHHDFLQGLGAEQVVDYHEDWVSAVRGVDAAFDCVGGDTFDGCLQAIRDGGRAVTIVASDRLEGNDPATAQAFRASATRERLTAIAALIDDGKVTPAISERLPLDDAARAHEIVETGHTRGKLVLIPG